MDKDKGEPPEVLGNGKVAILVNDKGEFIGSIGLTSEKVLSPKKKKLKKIKKKTKQNVWFLIKRCIFAV